MRPTDGPSRATRDAIDAMAGAEAGSVFDEAFAEARVEAKAILKDLMVGALVRHAAPARARASRPPGGGRAREWGLYTYGIVAAGEGPVAPSPGIDPAHGTELVAHEDLAAVVSKVWIRDFDEEEF